MKHLSFNNVFTTLLSLICIIFTAYGLFRADDILMLGHFPPAAVVAYSLVNFVLMGAFLLCIIYYWYCEGREVVRGDMFKYLSEVEKNAHQVYKEFDNHRNEKDKLLAEYNKLIDEFQAKCSKVTLLEGKLGRSNHTNKLLADSYNDLHDRYNERLQELKELQGKLDKSEEQLKNKEEILDLANATVFTVRDNFETLQSKYNTLSKDHDELVEQHEKSTQYIALLEGQAKKAY